MLKNKNENKLKEFLKKKKIIITIFKLNQVYFLIKNVLKQIKRYFQNDDQNFFLKK